MRALLTLSLPAKKKNEIEHRAKRAGKSTSAYVLSVLELEKQMISEHELAAMAKDAEKAYKEGKTKKIKSLNSLMKR